MTDHYISPGAPSIETATQVAKRKRQLPFSLTQAPTVAATALETADQHQLAADVHHPATAATPHKKRRKPTAIQQPAPRIIPEHSIPEEPDRSVTAAAAQHTDAEAPARSLHAPETQQQMGRESILSTAAPTRQQQSSSRKTSALDTAADGSKQSNTQHRHWMLTADEMLAVSDDQLLQQCRRCLDRAGRFATTAAAGQQQQHQHQQQGRDLQGMLQREMQQQQQQHLQDSLQESKLPDTALQDKPTRRSILQQVQQHVPELLRDNLQKQGSLLQQQQEPVQRLSSAAVGISVSLQKQQEQPNQASARPAAAAGAAPAAAATSGDNLHDEAGTLKARSNNANMSMSPLRGLAKLCNRLFDD